jgi:hypothetical protein
MSLSVLLWLRIVIFYNGALAWKLTITEGDNILQEMSIIVDRNWLPHSNQGKTKGTGVLPLGPQKGLPNSHTFRSFCFVLYLGFRPYRHHTHINGSTWNKHRTPEYRSWGLMWNLEKLAFMFRQNFQKLSVFIQMASGVWQKVQILFGPAHQAPNHQNLLRLGQQATKTTKHSRPWWI